MKIIEPDRIEERIVEHRWYGNEERIIDVRPLIRCKDCKYYDFGLCDNVPFNTMPRPREQQFFCADAKSRTAKLE